MYDETSGITLEWVDGAAYSVPDWAVICGHTSSGDPLYCARYEAQLVKYGGLYDVNKDCMQYRGFSEYECGSSWKIATLKFGM